MNRLLKLLFGWLMKTKPEMKPLPPIITDDPATPSAETKPETNVLDEIDLSTVKWHGPDIRAWKIAADLQASIKSGKIYMATDLLKGRAQTGDNGTTGNPWAIVKGSDNQWHAYTYEWIDYGRGHRDLWKAFDRGHGCPSVCTGAGVQGAEFYVAVATVSRGGKKANGNERTAFRKVVHP
jgi:hypothetical protein